MGEYTAPNNDAVDFETTSYTAPNNDGVDFKTVQKVEETASVTAQNTTTTVQNSTPIVTAFADSVVGSIDGTVLLSGPTTSSNVGGIVAIGAGIGTTTTEKTEATLVADVSTIKVTDFTVSVDSATTLVVTQTPSNFVGQESTISTETRSGSTIQNGSFAGVQTVNDTQTTPTVTNPLVQSQTFGVVATSVGLPNGVNPTVNTSLLTPNTSLLVVGSDGTATFDDVLPTLQLVVTAGQGGLNTETSFADSLSASVGAQTSINVAKTGSQFDTFTVLPNSFATPTVESQDVDTTTVASSLAFSTPLLTAQTSSVDPQSALDTASGVIDGTVTETVLDAVQAASQSDTVADVLATAANTVLNEGIVDTASGAAAVVAKVLAVEKEVAGDGTASVTGGLGEINPVIRRRNPLTETTGLSTRGTFNLTAVTESTDGRAIPKTDVVPMVVTQFSSNVSTAVTTLGAIQTYTPSSLNGIIELLSLTNAELWTKFLTSVLSNDSLVLRERKHNDVKIIND